MIIRTGGRKTGKTSDAIIMAHASKAIIITHSKMMATYIMDESKKMGMPVDAISIHMYLDNKQAYHRRGVILDQLEHTIGSILSENIVLATTDAIVMPSTPFVLPQKHTDLWWNK